MWEWKRASVNVGGRAVALVTLAYVVTRAFNQLLSLAMLYENLNEAWRHSGSNAKGGRTVLSVGSVRRGFLCDTPNPVDSDSDACHGELVVHPRAGESHGRRRQWQGRHGSRLHWLLSAPDP